MLSHLITCTPNKSTRLHLQWTLFVQPNSCSRSPTSTILVGIRCRLVYNSSNQWYRPCLNLRWISHVQPSLQRSRIFSTVRLLSYNHQATSSALLLSPSAKSRLARWLYCHWVKSSSKHTSMPRAQLPIRRRSLPGTAIFQMMSWLQRWVDLTLPLVTLCANNPLKQRRNQPCNHNLTLRLWLQMLG